MRRQAIGALLERQVALLHQAIVQRHTQASGEVPVAGARLAQRPVGGARPQTGARTQGAALGHHRQGFQGVRHLIVRQAEEAVAPAAARRHELGLQHLGEVRARSLRADARATGDLPGGDLFVAEQQCKHARARGIADHGGDACEARFGRAHCVRAHHVRTPRSHRPARSAAASSSATDRPAAARSPCTIAALPPAASAPNSATPMAPPA